jgi:hypothetical protein
MAGGRWVGRRPDLKRCRPVVARENPPEYLIGPEPGAPGCHHFSRYRSGATINPGECSGNAEVGNRASCHFCSFRD